MKYWPLALAVALCVGKQPIFGDDRASSDADSSVLSQHNLVAWCIVPFDAKKRSPRERAAMLKELGIMRCAYDWRAEHVPSFEEEILAYKEHGIEFFAFWGVHDEAFRLFEKHNLRPQIWQMMKQPSGDSQADRVEQAVQQMLPIAKRTKAAGCKLALYNHGGWSGEPQNLVAVCQRLHDLGHTHVGITYNFHHGHGHIDDWPTSLQLMLPYLHCLNINGMNADAEPKILAIGHGVHETAMIREILSSGYERPIGILDHRPEVDARKSLIENRDGLARIRNAILESSSR